MGIASDVRKLKGNIICLPYADREGARVLVHKWESVRRLSQMEQLKVDKFLESIEKQKEHKL